VDFKIVWTLRSREDLREIVVKNYRIVYRVHQKEKFLEILRGRHQRAVSRTESFRRRVKEELG